jgi:hypothetical protein
VTDAETEFVGTTARRINKGPIFDILLRWQFHWALALRCRNDLDSQELLDVRSELRQILGTRPRRIVAHGIIHNALRQGRVHGAARCLRHQHPAFLPEVPPVSVPEHPAPRVGR